MAHIREDAKMKLMLCANLQVLRKGKESIIAPELHRMLHFEWLSSFESFNSCLLIKDWHSSSLLSSPLMPL